MLVITLALDRQINRTAVWYKGVVYIDIYMFKKVFVLNPDNELVAVCIANALTLMKEKDEAYKYFEQALSIT